MNKFLVTSIYNKNKIKYFSGTDTEKLFKKNLKRQTHDWIYRNKQIEYQNNDMAFRTKSFNDVNWSESIVVFGCSIVYGIGLAEEDTFCFQLEQKLGRPVINLGIGASAVDLNHYNSMILHENFCHPKAVIHCWTSLARYTDFQDNNVQSFMSNDNNYMAKINWTEKSKIHVYSDRIMWKNKIIYKEYSFFDDTSKQLKIPKFCYLDHARDIMHPGIETNRAAAENIYQDLKKEGL